MTKISIVLGGKLTLRPYRTVNTVSVTIKLQQLLLQDVVKHN